jgi:protein-L-isoaspartate(D-aspartate) O-methyltransferase
MHAEIFADQLRILAALEVGPATDRVLDAFKAVPREEFAGPGPWKVLSPHEGFSLPVRETPDANPKWLYHSVLIVLDGKKGINVGDPVFWARRFARADIKPGARILQVGAGVGYYTAILSQLAGPDGHVLAYEVEAELAERARANLMGWPNTEVRHENAATGLYGDDRFDLIVAFAGITHVPNAWSSRLEPGAQLLVPLTGSDWWGATILAHKADQGFDAITLGRCGVYPCAGARCNKLEQRISEMFNDPSRLTNWPLRLIEVDGRAEPVA